MPNDEPTFISTERMPTLAADIRLVLAALDDAALGSLAADSEDVGVDWDEAQEVGWFRYAYRTGKHSAEWLAAYDRLKAAFGKDVE